MTRAYKKSRGEAQRYTNRKRALMAILTTTNLVEASEKAQIPYVTLYRMTQQPEFRRELEALQDKMLDNATATLMGGMMSAAKALITIVENPASSEMGKIAASRQVLDFADRLFVARNLEKRLRQLEASESEQTIEADNAIQNVTEAADVIGTAAESESVRSAATVDARIEFGFEKQPITEFLPTGRNESEQRIPQDSQANNQVSATWSKDVWTNSPVSLDASKAGILIP